MIRLCLTVALLLFVLPSGAGATGPRTSPLPVPPAVLDRPVWAVDPAEPGSDLPIAGRSLFDDLMAVAEKGKRTNRVPFPFTALVEKINGTLKNQPDIGMEGTGVKSVLMPINRSLQRDAAGGAFFAYPRVVLGIDAEPATRPGDVGLYLKDRLFLGYQEKSGIIEVISYNEAAGRFEFQVVRDYRPGGRAEVVYANRALCTVCHQNHGPIFSKPLWDETNANPKIASLLEAEGRAFYRMPIRQGIDLPNAIDDATDRANLFSAYQFLWQEGCEVSNSPPQSVACRADLTRLILQYRLKSPGISVSDLPSMRPFSARFIGRFKEKWPGGISIPNPDIPNRNRFAPQELPPSLFEPSVPRPPMARWHASTVPQTLAHDTIAGLSGFLAASDIQRLDEHLFRRGLRAGDPPVRYEASCQFQPRRRGNEIERILLQCQPPHRQTPGRAGGFSMEGVIYLKQGQIESGTLDRLSFGAGNLLTHLNVVEGTATVDRRKLKGRFGLAQKSLPLHARLADGRAIQGVSFEMAMGENAAASPAGDVALSGTATASVLDDFSPVHKAIDAMAEENRVGLSDGLAHKPFRRSAIVRSVFEKLDMPTPFGCCPDDTKMPAPLSRHDPIEHRKGDEEKRSLPVKAFYRYCAECHHEPEPFPPNFLHGSPSRVEANLRHCAERIFFRLEMGRIAPSERPHTPMPPSVSLKRRQLSPAKWADHPDLKAMKKYVVDSLKSSSRRPDPPEALTSQNYDTLRACLPPSNGQVPAIE